MSDHPSEIHGYTILEVLTVNPQDGRVAYLARDGDGRRVVLKRFTLVGFDASWSGYEDQRREIQVLRELDHPRIPAYLDWFSTDDGLCLVQAWIDVPPLSSRTSFSTAEVKDIARSLLEILVYLQERLPPVVHRDIKPENILVDDDANAYLVDFGLARAGVGTASTVAIGTPGFMAPEQMLGRTLSAATDLFAVGATLIAMLTGTRSHELGGLLDTSMRFDMSRLPSGLSPSFVQWLRTMVAADPAVRFSDARTALRALEPLELRAPAEVVPAPRAPATTVPGGPTPAPTVEVSSFPVGTVALVVGLGLVGAGAWAAFANHPNARTDPPVVTTAPPPPRPVAPPTPVEPESPKPVAPPARAETIHCNGPMTLDEVPPRTSKEVAIRANDGCDLTLRGVTLEADGTAIMIRGESTVRLVDSTVTAKDVGLDVRKAVVELVRSTVSAPTAAQVSSGGIIERDPESALDGEQLVDEESWIYGDDAEADAEQRQKSRLARYEKGACTPINACLKEHDFQGRIQFEMRADIAADGSVGRIRFVGKKRPPKAIAKCLTTRNREVTIPDYVAEDGPGVRICKIDSTLSGFMTSWSEDRGFELKG